MQEIKVINAEFKKQFNTYLHIQSSLKSLEDSAKFCMACYVNPTNDNDIEIAIKIANILFAVRDVRKHLPKIISEEVKQLEKYFDDRFMIVSKE